MRTPYRTMFGSIAFVILFAATRVDAQVPSSPVATNQAPYTIEIPGEQTATRQVTIAYAQP